MLAPGRPHKSVCGSAGLRWTILLAASSTKLLSRRRCEADAFYRGIVPSDVTEDAANAMRQALAGMLWSKQYFFLDADKWLEEHGADPIQLSNSQIRNREWFH